MSMLKLQGALLRGTESLWLGVRSHSSTRAKEETRRKWACEHFELLKVLEARVRQLRADGLSKMATAKLLPAPPRKSALPRPVPLESAAPFPARSEHAVQPSHWKEKPSKGRLIKYKRCIRLDSKLVASWTKPLPDWRRTEARVGEGGLESPAKDDFNGQAATCWYEREGRRKQTEVRTGLEAPGSLGRSHGTAKELEDPGLIRGGPEDRDDSSQHGSIQSSILAYLDCCVFLRQPERGRQCLMFYHRTLARRRWLDIRMYNVVMRGFARKGALHEVGKIFGLVEEARLKPTLDSYVAALECMGRTHAHPHVITRCLQQLKEDGFLLEDLLRGSAWEADRIEMALKAVRRVQPNFHPSPPRHRAELCTIPLLRDFYAKGEAASYPKLDFTAEDLRSRFGKQLEMEAAATVTIESVEATKPPGEEALKARKLLDALRSRWRESLLQSLQESKIHMAQQKMGRRNLYPFLCVLEDKEYVDILIWSLSSLPSQGQTLLILARELGAKVYNKYAIRKKSQSGLADRIRRVYESYVQLLAKDAQPARHLPRELWEQLEAEAGGARALVGEECAWPLSLLVQVGLFLVELLVQVLKMESNLATRTPEQKLIPVLYHVYSFRSGHLTGFIRPHPLLTRLVSEAAETTLTFDSFVIPMLCPPVPWVSPHFGAYILTPTKLMRCSDEAAQHQLALERSPRGDLFPVMDALNQLGNCPWKVNHAILDVVISIFNDKGDEKLDVPPPPSEAPQPANLSTDGGQPRSKFELKREAAACRKRAAEMYSLRMDALYKLSIAKHMKDRVFWFPHNMDFRGRTYPCPPHFNHLGSDVTRAILLFAEGRPLGPRGLDWLKIHLVNLTGLKKKSSLRDRLAYADEILADILDSADHPLTGNKWWMNTDEPWQALASCMEIAKAVRAPDPAAYISHFPVHQDGSCNGLQHYAALGRDIVGAASVNLTPCDVPQDVYSGVAQKVEMFRKKDAEQGVKIAQALEGFVERKVVKQTVMTVVYGVTRYGGRLQIEKRLEEMENFPQEYVWEASLYLVRQVFNSLKEMFSGTREIQAWLTESARLIAKSGRTVEWVTPLGLPIIQPYHRSKTIQVLSNLQSVSMKSCHDISQKPDTRKQKNAFPPNFIHSLDSTHMMLTALHCHRRGLTFVSVHDCYWTHALTIDVMNQVCREQFVDLHSQPILQNLSEFMLKKYCTESSAEWKSKTNVPYEQLLPLLSQVPKGGDFDLQLVKESTYFFS